MNFQQLILGNQKIETESQRRKLLLGAYLILMYLGVDIYFLLVNLYNSQGEPITLFVGAAVSLTCLYLIKRGWIDSAIALHLVRSASLAFYFSYMDSDPL